MRPSPTARVLIERASARSPVIGLSAISEYVFYRGKTAALPGHGRAGRGRFRTCEERSAVAFQRARVMPWSLGALLVAAVAFGPYVWGRTPNHGTSPPRPTTPFSVGQRTPIPTGNPPGWREVFADDFSGSALDTSKWRLYWGQPGGDPAGWFDPSHVSVSNGELVITASRHPAHGGRWATGGVSSSPGLVQIYGKYLVRFRFDAGVGIAHALVLTPADGTWPPEVDFSEDNGSSHRATLVTLHYRPRDRKISGEEAVDLRQWHTLGVEWTTGLLRYTLDGRTWFTTANPAVPRVPMALAIQTQAWPCAGTWAVCPGRSTPRVVSLRVDWVVAYAPAAPR